MQNATKYTTKLVNNILEGKAEQVVWVASEGLQG